MVVGGCGAACWRFADHGVLQIAGGGDVDVFLLGGGGWPVVLRGLIGPGRMRRASRPGRSGDQGWPGECERSDGRDEWGSRGRHGLQTGRFAEAVVGREDVGCGGTKASATPDG